MVVVSACIVVLASTVVSVTVPMVMVVMDSATRLTRKLSVVVDSVVVVGMVLMVVDVVVVVDTVVVVVGRLVLMVVAGMVDGIVVVFG